MNKGDLELMATTVSVVLIVGVVVISVSSLFKVSHQTMFSFGRLLHPPELGVYQDQALSSEATHINWSSVEPNSQTNRTIWLKCLGSATLYMTTDNWQPVNDTVVVTDYISCVWDQEGKTIAAQEVRQATLTLVVSADVHNITDLPFSFDITLRVEA